MEAHDCNWSSVVGRQSFAMICSPLKFFLPTTNDERPTTVSGRQVVTALSRCDCRFSGSGSMMKRMSFSETVFLFVLALVVFGPKKLPEIARQSGKYLNEFKRASNEFKAQIEQEIAHLEVEKQTILPPSPTPEGATSRNLYAAPAEAPVVATPSEAPSVDGSATPEAEDEPLFAAATTERITAPSADLPASSESAVQPSQASHV
jgi:sec-independent protein translocase protein TatB